MKRLKGQIIKIVAFLGIFLTFMYVGEVKAEGEETTTGGYTYVHLTDTNIQITRYSGTESECVIPASIDGYNVTSIGEMAFNNCEKITTIKVPEGVTEIGDNAFYRCIKMESIELPDSLISIGKMLLCGTMT